MSGGKVWLCDGGDYGQTMRVVDGRALVSAVSPAPIVEDGLGPFFRFADTNGDGTGAKNANGDYSLAEEEFFIQPPAGQVYDIYRLIITIRDSGTFRADRYAALAASLVNGIQVQKRTGASTVVSDCTDGIPIVANVGWARYSYDVSFFSFGAGDNFISSRWTFRNSGRPIQINDSQRFSIVLNDDLTGIVQHYFNVQGIRIV